MRDVHQAWVSGALHVCLLRRSNSSHSVLCLACLIVVTHSKTPSFGDPRNLSHFRPTVDPTGKIFDSNPSQLFTETQGDPQPSGTAASPMNSLAFPTMGSFYSQLNVFLLHVLHRRTEGRSDSSISPSGLNKLRFSSSRGSAITHSSSGSSREAVVGTTC